jgi:hypothetical protein
MPSGHGTSAPARKAFADIMQTIAGSGLRCLHKVGLKKAVYLLPECSRSLILLIEALRLNAKSASGDLHKSSTRHALCAQQHRNSDYSFVSRDSRLYGCSIGHRNHF